MNVTPSRSNSLRSTTCGGSSRPAGGGGSAPGQERGRGSRRAGGRAGFAGARRAAACAPGCRARAGCAAWPPLPRGAGRTCCVLGREAGDRAARLQAAQEAARPRGESKVERLCQQLLQRARLLRLRAPAGRRHGGGGAGGAGRCAGCAGRRRAAARGRGAARAARGARRCGRARRGRRGARGPADCVLAAQGSPQRPHGWRPRGRGSTWVVGRPRPRLHSQWGLCNGGSERAGRLDRFQAGAPGCGGACAAPPC
jgi:hypothetical protein